MARRCILKSDQKISYELEYDDNWLNIISAVIDTIDVYVNRQVAEANNRDKFAVFIWLSANSMKWPAVSCFNCVTADEEIIASMWKQMEPPIEKNFSVFDFSVVGFEFQGTDAG